MPQFTDITLHNDVPAFDSFDAARVFDLPGLARMFNDDNADTSATLAPSPDVRRDAATAEAAPRAFLVEVLPFASDTVKGAREADFAAVPGECGMEPLMGEAHITGGAADEEDHADTVQVDAEEAEPMASADRRTWPVSVPCAIVGTMPVAAGLVAANDDAAALRVTAPALTVSARRGAGQPLAGGGRHPLRAPLRACGPRIRAARAARRPAWLRARPCGRGPDPCGEAA